MRLHDIGVVPAVCLLSGVSLLSAQQIQSTAPVTSVPRLVRISGTFRPAIAQPAEPVESVTFSIYKEQEGGTPLWQETQNVTMDVENHYTVLIGSTLNEGIPLELFASGEPRWLGVRFNRPGEVEQARTQMVSVPYALRASDAETLGGLPAAAYLRAPGAASSSARTTATAATGTSATTTESARVKPKATSGTANCIATFTNATDLGCSPMWQSGGNIGVGTTAPATTLDIQNGAAGFTNLLNMRSNFTGGGVGAAGVTLSHQFSTMLMRAYSPGAPGLLQNSIGWFALNGSNKLLIGHAGTSPGNDLGFFTSNSWANPQLVLTQAGKVGIGTTTPAVNLDVVGQINANNVSGSGPAVQGTSNSPAGAGVRGFNNATSGFPAGVQGGVGSNSGAGVLGIASQAGAVAVQGNNNAATGFAVGVQGNSNSNSGAGVQGNASGAGAVGVMGNSGSTSGFTAGVAGNASSPNGAGVSGYNSDTSGTGYPVGVVGGVAGSTGTGVQGNASHAGATGVNGFNSDTSGTGFPVGVSGGVAGSTGAGVGGNASHAGASGVSGFNSATSGFANGVQGGTASNNGAGVQGNASQAGAAGVAGWNSATSGYAVGVQGGTSSTNGAGVSGNSNRAGVFGVVGFNGATSGYAIGTEGASSSPGGVGVWAVDMACGSTGCTLVPGTAGQFQTATNGVLLQGIAGAAGANIGTATQVFVVDGHGNGSYAGNLQVGGNLTVGGTISKSGGSFRIDDPIDPANKYLYHSFVESPDMKNIYDGVVTLDEKGEAVVALPEWFEALNQEFRYQLTCIGGYAPVYVASEIFHNQFHIAGGAKGLKVSWQVTGVRHDTYANSHRIPVEVEKSANEKGVIDPVTPAATTTP